MFKPADGAMSVLEQSKYCQNETNAAIERTDLGLALVSELMALHGGWVEKKSRIGYGCTFCIGFLMDNNAA
jgi:signal transduction histidine kinase|tara:strand:- start:81 stop:293 length:213 start_codon:yes stop_codon:yes gene_type:complete